MGSNQAKNFVDDTSIFSVMMDSVSASVTLNHYLNFIFNWAYTWKISFNPDPSKQEKEITVSKKRCNTQLPVLFFNNSIISPFDSNKHLCMILDSKLNFKCH